MLRKIISLALLLVMPAVLVAMKPAGAGDASATSFAGTNDLITQRLMKMSEADLQILVDDHQKFIKQIELKLKEIEKDSNKSKHTLEKAQVIYFKRVEQEVLILAKPGIQSFLNVLAQCVILSRRIKTINSHSCYDSFMTLGLDEDYVEEPLDKAEKPLDRNTPDLLAKEKKFRAKVDELKDKHNEALYRKAVEEQEVLLTNAVQTLRVITEKSKREHLAHGRFDDREKAGFEKMRNELALLATERGFTEEIKNQAKEYYDTMTHFRKSKIGQFCFATAAHEEEMRRAAEAECVQEEANAQSQNGRAGLSTQPVSQPSSGLAKPGGKGPKGTSWLKVVAGVGVAATIVWGFQRWYALTDSSNRQPSSK